MGFGNAGLPKVKFNGTGIVKKCPIGKFIYEVLKVVDPYQVHYKALDRHFAKQRIMEILFQHLAIERNENEPVTKDYQKNIIHDLMDHFLISDSDTIGIQLKEGLKAALRKFLIGVENGSLKKD